MHRVFHIHCNAGGSARQAPQCTNKIDEQSAGFTAGKEGGNLSHLGVPMHITCCCSQYAMQQRCCFRLQGLAGTVRERSGLHGKVRRLAKQRAPPPIGTSPAPYYQEFTEPKFRSLQSLELGSVLINIAYKQMIN